MVARELLVVTAYGLLLALEHAAVAGDLGVEIVGTQSGRAFYGVEDLAALPQHKIVTHTSVTDGPQVFVGPLMRDVMADAGLEVDTITATALNDYEIAIPTSDFTRFNVIAALSMNGEALTPRDKGPVWIVYPRDDHTELQDIRYDYRWVWQLIRIEPR